MRMTNELQPLAALCMDGRFADYAAIWFWLFATEAIVSDRGRLVSAEQRMS